MRIRVEPSIEVDPEAWMLAYGEVTLGDLRNDVREYALAQVRDSAAANEGGITSVSASR